MPASPIVSQPALHDYAAFSDESHSDGTNIHMVIGGVLTRSADAHLVSAEISRAYGRRFPEAIQWKSVSKAKIGVLKEALKNLGIGP